MMGQVSVAEESFVVAWSSVVGGAAPCPEREYVFFPGRRWRFDFAWPEVRVAVEIDGRGRHQTVAGVRNDCEKWNAAVADGWRVLRFPATDRSEAGEWADLVWRVMAGVEAEFPAWRRAT